MGENDYNLLLRYLADGQIHTDILCLWKNMIRHRVLKMLHVLLFIQHNGNCVLAMGLVSQNKGWMFFLQLH